MMRRLRAPAWLPRQFSAYFLASLVALAVDLGILLVLASFIHYLYAATIGFCAGTAVSYLLSTRLVFDHRRMAHRERLELAVFAGVGVAGLVLNNLVIFLMVELTGAPLAGAKLVAAGASFLFNYLLRKHLLFRKA